MDELQLKLCDIQGRLFNFLQKRRFRAQPLSKPL